MKKYFVGALALWVVVLTGCSSSTITNGALDDFATCIKDAGITVYVADGCGHCTTQKNLFEGSFELLNSVSCNKEPERCGIIKGRTPTWVLANGEQLVGVQSLEKLAEASACELPVTE